MRFFNGINYKMLTDQKETLLAVIERQNDKQEKEDLTGILHLIDAIQDHAVDAIGLPADRVFGGKEREGETS